MPAYHLIREPADRQDAPLSDRTSATRDLARDAARRHIITTAIPLREDWLARFEVDQDATLAMPGERVRAVACEKPGCRS